MISTHAAMYFSKERGAIKRNGGIQINGNESNERMAAPDGNLLGMSRISWFKLGLLIQSITSLPIRWWWWGGEGD